MKKLFLFILMFAYAPFAGAQVVEMGHVNFITDEPESNIAFWELLGGEAANKNGVDYVKFPGVIITFSPGTPSGGTAGTVINHFGLQFSDLESVVEKLQAAGHLIVTEDITRGMPNITVADTFIATNHMYNVRYAFTLAPNGARIELYENSEMDEPVRSHHVHFQNPYFAMMKAWYVDMFGAVPGTRTGMEAADMEGINLTFSPNADLQLPTKSRAIDHIGFEVIGLSHLSEKLKASNVPFKNDVGMDETLGIMSATIIGPWGTTIKLTEGLKDF